MSSVYHALYEFKPYRSKKDKVIIEHLENGHFMVARWLHGSGSETILLAEHRASLTFEQYLIYPVSWLADRIEGLFGFLRSRGWSIPRVKFSDSTIIPIAEVGRRTYLANMMVFTRDNDSGLVKSIYGVEVILENPDNPDSGPRVFQKFSDVADMILDANDVIDTLKEAREKGVKRVFGKPVPYHIDKLSRLVAWCEAKYEEIGTKYGLAYGFVYAEKLREADSEVMRFFREVDNVYTYALNLYFELQSQLQGGNAQENAQAKVPVAQAKP
ncbi:MAG: hypothetical protein JHC26_11840 [Thermofilum sp.]|jgi:hypothetical protein|uniref:hypothetical protein n=1 Tax=Thermofilum sp. TaxID=1961369 RepID=UPI0025878511|nr:hypothetical protein [Thermofilum sp.]MCI4409775.1 hypothetical protein [Thermofilum sp.]